MINSVKRKKEKNTKNNKRIFSNVNELYIN